MYLNIHISRSSAAFPYREVSHSVTGFVCWRHDNCAYANMYVSFLMLDVEGMKEFIISESKYRNNIPGNFSYNNRLWRTLFCHYWRINPRYMEHYWLSAYKRACWYHLRSVVHIISSWYLGEVRMINIACVVNLVSTSGFLSPGSQLFLLVC